MIVATVVVIAINNNNNKRTFNKYSSDSLHMPVLLSYDHNLFLKALADFSQLHKMNVDSMFQHSSESV